jgi:hypothetical protein
MTHKFTFLAFVLAMIAALAGMPQIAHAFDKISVTNNGKMPLKVVILDEKFKEIGRSGSDFKKGSFTVSISPAATKYHWEAFRVGDLEPCVKKRDETSGSISLGCDIPGTLKAGGDRWGGLCVPTGAGGPIETCCKRQRLADKLCNDPTLGDICDLEQSRCQYIVDHNKNVGKR